VIDLALFYCRPLAAKLQRRHCGDRHALGKDPTCATCPVGRAHRKGQEIERWPDGAVIQTILYRPGVGDITKIRIRRRLAVLA
jgi:hypothetical protein